MVVRAGVNVPPWLLAITAMLAVQLSNAFSAPLVERIGSAGTTWLRFSFGALLLWLFVRPVIRNITKKDIPALLAFGVVTGCMTTLFLAAAERIPLGTAVAIEFLGPLTVAGLMSKHRRALIWPVLAFVGVVLLTEPWTGSVDIVGVGFALGAGVCWGLYNILTQHVGDKFSGITGLALTLPVAALITMPFGIAQATAGDFEWWMVAAAAGIAILAPVVGYGLEMLALRRMSHTSFGTLLSIEPAFGVIVGLIVLAQTPSIVQIIGISVVVAAGAAAQKYSSRETN